MLTIRRRYTGYAKNDLKFHARTDDLYLVYVSKITCLKCKVFCILNTFVVLTIKFYIRIYLMKYSWWLIPKRILPFRKNINSFEPLSNIWSFVCKVCKATDSTKINRPGPNIRMYWTNFRQPTAHLQQDIFEKILIEVGSLHLYASFGTFCVQIGQLFAPQWVFKHSEEFRNRRHFPSKTANCRFSNIPQRLTVPWKINQF